MMNTTDQSLDLLELVVLAMCREPKQLRTIVDRSPGALIVSFEANPADTKRLVGAQGSMIHSLSNLFRLLMRRDRSVNPRIDQMIPNGKQESFALQSHEPFPTERFENLLRRIGEHIFQVPVTITTRDGHGAMHMTMRIEQEKLDEQTARGLGRCVLDIFSSAGQNHGRRLNVQVCGAYERTAELRSGAVAGSHTPAR